MKITIENADAVSTENYEKTGVEQVYTNKDKQKIAIIENENTVVLQLE